MDVEQEPLAVAEAVTAPVTPPRALVPRSACVSPTPTVFVDPAALADRDRIRMLELQVLWGQCKSQGF
jgi:hypothetical protein